MKSYYEKISQNEPYLLQTRSDAAASYIVMLEKHPYYTAVTSTDALLYLFATYYTFNIAYPKYFNLPLTFVQYYMYNIQEHITSCNTSIVQLFSSISKI